MADIELMLEAERRGLLPPEKVQLLDEARSRGLIPQKEEAPIPEPKSMSTADSLKRQAGLTGRAIIQGAGDIANIVGGPVSVLTGGAVRPPRVIAEETATSLGLPMPETTTERYVGAANRGLVGGGGMVGAGQLLAKAPGIMGRFGSVLSAAPEAQFGASVGAPVAVEAARDVGLGPTGQAAAGLTGAVIGAKGGSMAGKMPATMDEFSALFKPTEKQYVVPPSQTKAPTAASKMLETLSGKAKTEQYASSINQQITNQKVIKDLGMPENTVLSDNLLQGYRAQMYADGYLPIQNTGYIKGSITSKLGGELDSIAKESRAMLKSYPDSPIAQKIVDEVDSLKQTAGKYVKPNDTINKIKELRELATKAYKSDDTSLGKAYKDMANTLEDMLETHLAETGKTDLLANFRTARQNIAKAHSVENALVGENVSAAKLAQQLDKKRPLSGGMREAAEQAKKTPKSMTVPPSGAVNPFTLPDVVWGSLATAGTTVAGPGGLVAALPLARPLARGLILSQPYQRGLTQPTAGMPALLKAYYGAEAANQ